MIGTYYNNHCVEDPNKKPLQLNSNFYRAIIEAEALCNGKVVNVSHRRKSALIAPSSDNYRILISQF